MFGCERKAPDSIHTPGGRADLTLLPQGSQRVLSLGSSLIVYSNPGWRIPGVQVGRLVALRT